MVRRNSMGKFAFLVGAIDAGYTYLDSEKKDFEEYDGGQGLYENSTFYEDEMKVIVKMETELKTILELAVTPWEE